LAATLATGRLLDGNCVSIVNFCTVCDLSGFASLAFRPEINGTPYTCQPMRNDGDLSGILP